MTFTRGHYVTQNCILIGTNWVIKETNNPLLVLFCALFVFIIKKVHLVYFQVTMEMVLMPLLYSMLASCQIDPDMIIIT